MRAIRPPMRTAARCTLLCLLVSALLPHGLQVALAEEGWGPVISVSGDTGEVGAPRLYVGQDGAVHLVWHASMAGDQRLFYAYKRPGNAWSAPENVPSLYGQPRFPAIAQDSRGILHMVWEDSPSPAGPSRIVYATRPIGGQWSVPEPLSPEGNVAHSPVIVVDGSSTVYVFWEEQTPDGYDIMYRARPLDAPWIPAINLSNNAGYSTCPSVAIGPDGTLHVAWDDDVSGNGEILYMQKPRGEGWSQALNVSQNGGQSIKPAIATDEDGRVHLVWRDNTPGTASVFYAVRGREGGWSRPENITPSSQEAGVPALASEGRGHVCIVWESSGVLLYMQKASGGGWGAVSPVPGSEQARDPSLGLNHGVLHLAWEKGDPGQNKVMYIRKGPGRAWSVPEEVPFVSGHSQHLDIEIGPDGTLYLVWEENLQGNLEVLFTLRRPGGEWGPVENISSSAGASGSPDLALDALGIAHVVWEEEIGRNSEIYYACRSPDGVWSAPVNVSATQGASSSPALALDETGAVHVAWCDHTPGNPDIFYAFRESDGSWSRASNASGTPGYSAEPTLAVDSHNVVHVAWTDSSLGNSEIFHAQRTPGGPWSATENVSQNESYSSDPSLAITSDGSLHLLWEDNVRGDPEILYAVNRGGGWSPALNVSQTLGPSTTPYLLADEGILHAFWEERVSGQREIFYAERRADGLWSGPANASLTGGESMSPTAALGADRMPYLAWQETTLDGYKLFYAFRINRTPYAPLDLRVNGLSDPAGLAEAHPTFQWAFSDPDEDDAQSAYRLLVASTLLKLASDVADMWDSGKVSRATTSEAVYAGQPLVWGQSYYWKVKVWDNNGLESAYSAPARFTMNAPPRAPQNLACEGQSEPWLVTTRRPLFSWNFSDPDGDRQGAYRLLVATQPELLDSDLADMWDTGMVAEAIANEVRYAGAGLAWGETYYWKVKTWDEHGLEGPYSEKRSFRLSALPDPPHDPVCEGRSNPTRLTNTTPSFGWTFYDADPDDGQSAYRILVASDLQILAQDHGDMWDSGVVASSASQGIRYAGQPLAWGHTYFWKVATWDRRLWQGPYCAPQSFAMNTPPNPPAQPVCNPVPGDVYFSWFFSDPDPDDAQLAYRILVASNLQALERGIGDLWDSGIVGSAESSRVAYGGQALAHDVRYFWKVCTWDEGGLAGPYSLPQEFELDHPPHPPREPLCEGETSPQGVADPTPEFSWAFTDPDEGDEQGAYRILVASSQAALEADIGDMWDSGRVVSSASSEIPYGGAALSWGERYYWKVKTWDRWGMEGGFCPIQSWTMNSPPDSPRSPLCTGRRNPGAVIVPSFSWTFADSDAGDVQGAYQLLVASSAINLVMDIGDMWDSGKVASLTSEDVRYEGAPLAPGETYYWKVRTWDNHDLPGPYCNVQSFTMRAPMIAVQPRHVGGVCPGREQQYVVEITNSMTRVLFDVRLLALLPAQVAFREASGGGVYDPVAHSVTWRLGDMARAERRQVTLSVLIGAEVPPETRLITRFVASAKGIVYDVIGLGETVRDCAPSPTPTSTPSPTPTRGASTPEATATPTATGTATTTPMVTPGATPTAESATGAIAGLVWEDRNWNGRMEAGEPPLAGVTIILRPEGFPGSEQTRDTDVSGRYLFEQLPPGSYLLTVRLPSGFLATTVMFWRVPVAAGERYEVDWGLVRPKFVHCPLIATH